MDFTDDPELAKEMIKLLGQELKQVRSQLHEANQRAACALHDSPEHIERAHTAEAENIDLKARIVELGRQLELERSLTAKSYENDDKKSGSLQLRVSIDRLEQQLEEASVEKTELIRINAEEASRLQEKLAHSRERYKKQKICNGELQEELKAVKLQLEEVRRSVAKEVEEAALTMGSPPGEFDIQAFLRAPDPPIVQNRPYGADLQPYSKKLEFTLPAQVTEKICASLYPALHYSPSEVLWSSDDKCKGVAITPMHRYNPKHKSSHWERVFPGLSVGQKRDLFFRDPRGWTYLGTFECIKTIPINIEQLKMLGSAIETYVYKRTMLFPDLIPPFLQNMAEEMYSAGVLRAECFLFQCVAFDEVLCNKLLEKSSKLGTPIAIPGTDRNTSAIDNWKKRKGADEVREQDPGSKKSRIGPS